MIESNERVVHPSAIEVAQRLNMREWSYMQGILDGLSTQDLMARVGVKGELGLNAIKLRIADKVPIDSFSASMNRLIVAGICLGKVNGRNITVSMKSLFLQEELVYLEESFTGRTEVEIRKMHGIENGRLRSMNKVVPYKMGLKNVYQAVGWIAQSKKDEGKLEREDVERLFSGS